MIGKRSLYLAALIVAVLAGAAQTPPDPCKLLSVQEVEAVMQIPMKPGRLRDGRSSFSGLSCTYFSQNQFEGAGTVRIIIDTTADMKESGHIYPSAKAMYDKQKYAYMQALKRQNKSSDFQPVEGVGDDAFWDGTSLKIIAGDIYLSVSATGGSAKAQEASGMIARRLLLRLKQ